MGSRTKIPIPPFPDAIHVPTKEEALEQLHAHGRRFGYDVSIASSKSNDAGKTCSYQLKCTRGGHPRKNKTPVELQTRPNRGSKRCGCRMEVKFTADDKDNVEGSWSIRSSGDPATRTHQDHYQLEEPKVFPGHRRRALAAYAPVITEHFAAGIDPRRSMSAIQRGEGGAAMLVPRDIYNVRQRARQSRIQGLTPTERMLRDLDSIHAYHRSRVENGRITHLFVVAPQAADTLRLSPELLFIDCTYSTNRYNLPVLHIVGVNGNNKTIPVGVALLPNEQEPSLRWALLCLKDYLESNDVPHPQIVLTDRAEAQLNALETVLPRTKLILCRWHIDKGVETWGRSHIAPRKVDELTGLPVEDEDTARFLGLYRDAMYANTEPDFNAARRKLHTEFEKGAIYLDREWFKYKEMCVAAWLHTRLHYGNTTTSRIEGAHAAIKGWLTSSKFDLYSLGVKLTAFWEERYRDLKLNTEQDSRLNIPTRLMGEMFTQTVSVIHRYPLMKTYEKLQLARGEIAAIKKDKNFQPSQCTHVYRTTHGMPCKHDLIQFIREETVLLPQHFDLHWWIQRPIGGELVVRESRINAPLVRYTRSNQSSRIPSAFESTLQPVASQHPRSTASAVSGSDDGQARRQQSDN
jgi:hypothetical protein